MRQWMYVLSLPSTLFLHWLRFPGKQNLRWDLSGSVLIEVSNLRAWKWAVRQAEWEIWCYSWIPRRPTRCLAMWGIRWAVQKIHLWGNIQQREYGGGGGIYLLALPFLLFPIRQCPAINTPGWPGLRWSLGKLDPMLVSSEMQWEEPDLWHLSQTVGALWVCCCCDSCDGANGQGSEIQVKMRDSEKVQKHWLMKSSNLAFS